MKTIRFCPQNFVGFLFLYSFLILALQGCVQTPIVKSPNYSELAQKKILNRDYEGARTVLSTWYEKTDVKTEKGEALYWIAYTHIKESSYKEARNFLETADKLYRNGPLLGVISSRIIACALAEQDLSRALKQYHYISEKNVGEISEIDFLIGYYYIKKSDLANARVYLQKCVNSGDNFFARKAKSVLSEISDGGGYYLQLGLYSNMSSANNAANRVKADFGIKAYIKEINANGTRLFVLCLGNYNSRFEAEKDMRLYKMRYSNLDMLVRP